MDNDFTTNAVPIHEGGVDFCLVRFRVCDRYKNNVK